MEVNPDSWVVHDALRQCTALLYRRHVLSTNSKASPSGKNTTSKLSKVDVQEDLRLLQQWLQPFVSFADVDEIYEVLSPLCTDGSTQHNPQQQSRASILSPNKAPSTQDKKASIDELRRDNSVEFFVFDTIYVVLKSLLNRFQSKPDELYAGLMLVPSALIRFSCEHLHHTKPIAVRHAASQCLGMLSKHPSFLQTVTQILSSKLSAISKSEHYREFSSFQPVVGYLQFNLLQDTHIEGTAQYLTDISMSMKKIVRGVLRREICASLQAVFDKTLPLDRIADLDPDSRNYQATDSATVKRKALLLQWWRAYEHVFAIVWKWKDKTKHFLFSVGLLHAMVLRHCNFDFYLKKSLALVKLLVDAFHKKDFREKALNYTVSYLRDTPMTFVQRDTAAFHKQLGLIMTRLFPKKEIPPEQDHQLLIQIVRELCVHAPQFMVAECIKPILELKSSYSDPQKSIVMYAIGQLAAEEKSSLHAYLDDLLPLIAVYIEIPKFRKPVLLRAALTCFPSIQHSDSKRNINMMNSIWPMMVDKDREVSKLAAMVMNDFVQADPMKNLLGVIAYHVYLLTPGVNFEPLDTEEVFRVVNNLVVILTDIAVWIRVTRRQMTTEALFSHEDWVGLRHHIEGVVLLLLCHNEQFIRHQAAQLLWRFAYPEFRLLEDLICEDQKLTSPPWLSDAIFGPGNAPPSEELTMQAFPSQLARVLKTRFQDFKGPIVWAWAALFPSFNDLLHLKKEEKATLHRDNMWYQSFCNKFVFLCLAVRVPSKQETGTSIRTLQLPKIEPQQKKKAKVPVSVPCPALKSPAIYVIDDVQLNSFFAVTAEYITGVLAEHKSNACYAILLDAVCEMDISCAQMLMTQLTAPMPQGSFTDSLKNQINAETKKIVSDGSARHHRRATLRSAGNSSGLEAKNAKLLASAKKRGRSKQFHPLSHFYYHETVVRVLASIFSKVTPKLYFEEEWMISDVLDSCVDTWLEEQDSILPIDCSMRCKAGIASIVNRFLELRVNVPDDVVVSMSRLTRSQVLSLREPFFSMVTGDGWTDVSAIGSGRHAERGSLADNQHHRKSTTQVFIIDRFKRDEPRTLLVIQICRCLKALIELGSFSKKSLAKDFLFQLDALIPHSDAGLRAALKFNPWFLKPFLQQCFESDLNSYQNSGSAFGFGQLVSFNRSSSNASFRSHIGVINHSLERNGGNDSSVNMSVSHHSKFGNKKDDLETDLKCNDFRYLQAIVLNWCEDTDRWIHEYKIHPAALLLVSCLHQSSTAEEARRLALKLAAKLQNPRGKASEDEEDYFGLGSGIVFQSKYPLRHFINKPVLFFLRQTVRYSSGVASNSDFLPLLPSVLHEASHIAPLLTVNSRDVLLRVIHPWAAQFSVLVARLLTMNWQYNNNPNHPNAFVVCKMMVQSLIKVTRDCYEMNFLAESLAKVWTSVLSNETEHNLIVSTFVTDILLSMYIDGVPRGNYSSWISAPFDLQHVLAAYLRDGENANMSFTAVSVGSSSGNTDIGYSGPESLLDDRVGDKDNSSASSLHTIDEEGGGELPPALALPSVSPDGKSSNSFAKRRETGQSMLSLEEYMRTASAAVTGGSGSGSTKIPSTPSGSSQSSRSPSSSSIPSATSAAAVASPASGSTSKNSNKMAPSPGRRGQSGTSQLVRSELVMSVFLHIVRCKAAEDIVAVLASKFRTYRHNEEKFDQMDKFMAWQAKRVMKDEPITLVEQASHEIVKLLFAESSELLASYAPLLLQNNCVLFAGEDSLEDAIGALGFLVGIESAAHLTTVDELVARVKAHPDTRETARAWAKIALSWALNSQDTVIRRRSFAIYAQLVDCVPELAVGSLSWTSLITKSLYTAVRLRDASVIESIAQLLLECERLCEMEEPVVHAVLCSGYALLHSSHTRTFTAGLAIVANTIRCRCTAAEAVSDWHTASISVCMCNALCATPVLLTQGGIDQDISHALSKGLLGDSTQEPAAYVVSALACGYAPFLPRTNGFIVLDVLMNLLLTSAFIEESQSLDSQKLLLRGAFRTQYTRKARIRAALCFNVAENLRLYGSQEGGDDELESFAESFEQLGFELHETVAHNDDTPTTPTEADKKGIRDSPNLGGSGTPAVAAHASSDASLLNAMATWSLHVIAKNERERMSHSKRYSVLVSPRRQTRNRRQAHTRRAPLEVESHIVKTVSTLTEHMVRCFVFAGSPERSASDILHMIVLWLQAILQRGPLELSKITLMILRGVLAAVEADPKGASALKKGAATPEHEALWTELAEIVVQKCYAKEAHIAALAQEVGYLVAQRVNAARKAKPPVSAEDGKKSQPSAVFNFVRADVRELRELVSIQGGMGTRNEAFSSRSMRSRTLLSAGALPNRQYLEPIDSISQAKQWSTVLALISDVVFARLVAASQDDEQGEEEGSLSTYDLNVGIPPFNVAYNDDKTISGNTRSMDSKNGGIDSAAEHLEMSRWVSQSFLPSDELRNPNSQLDFSRQHDTLNLEEPGTIEFTLPGNEEEDAENAEDDEFIRATGGDEVLCAVLRLNIAPNSGISATRAFTYAPSSSGGIRGTVDDNELTSDSETMEHDDHNEDDDDDDEMSDDGSPISMKGLRPASRLTDDESSEDERAADLTFETQIQFDDDEDW